MVSTVYRTKVLENGRRIIGGDDPLRRNCSMYVDDVRRSTLAGNVSMYVSPPRMRCIHEGIRK